MSEQLIRWEPANNLMEKYTLDLIFYTFQEFKLILSHNQDRSKKVHVCFEESVNAYKWTNANIWLAHIINESNNEKGYLHWTFFKVANSNYLHWISENTCGFYPMKNDVHFSFITTNVVIDVICYKEPKIEIVNE